jgi:hypothetical protein
VKIPGLAVIVVPAAVSATVRDFARTSAAQLRFPFDLYAVANDRHIFTQMAFFRC